MKLKLKIWRQMGRKDKGRFVSYAVDDVNPEMSMLECLDVLNEDLSEHGQEPVAFEHDCREGICGSCGFMINGVAHGPEKATTVCQLTMRHFKDGEELVLEPWQSRAFPFVKDLVVDRRSFDRIIQSGGYVSVLTGNAPDGNAIPVGKEIADRAMDALTPQAISTARLRRSRTPTAEPQAGRDAAPCRLRRLPGTCWIAPPRFRAAGPPRPEPARSVRSASAMPFAAAHAQPPSGLR